MFQNRTASIPLHSAAAARRLAFAAILVATTAAAATLSYTGALFTDTQSVGSNTFSTGTVDIATSPTSAIVTFSDMLAGDEVTAPVTVSNDGTVQMRYAVESTTTEDTLAAQLSMTIKAGVTTCDNAEFDTDGTVLYGPGDLGSTGTTAIIGDSSAGAQAGDRTLNASASETLCVQVSLPAATDNSFQGLTTTATLDFIAEQTTNNP